MPLRAAVIMSAKISKSMPEKSAAIEALTDADQFDPGTMR